jgi:D-aminopeptidase
MVNKDLSIYKRARDYGWVPLSHFKTGPYNSITDVSGVLVGHVTLIIGEPGPIEVGRGPIRTGVTAIRPHPGNIYTDQVAAGVSVLNGYGKTIGLEQIRELGKIETPILLTNTFNTWQCANALLDWVLQENPDIGIISGSLNPVVGEANDSWLNDIQGRHVNKTHVYSALNNAKSGFVDEGGIGAGTGMVCFGFKGGIGTASRVLPDENGGFTIGIMTLTNFGSRSQLIVRGQQVGKDLVNYSESLEETGERKYPEDGSCIMIIATDAPLSSRQLVRIANRGPLGLARTGFTSSSGSGDYVISFSTTNRQTTNNHQVSKKVNRLVDEGKTISIMFQAVVEAAEESVLNSLVAGKTISGRDSHIAHAIPINLINEMISDKFIL